jgi:uncharacterized LabA/DUF88 family protein
MPTAIFVDADFFLKRFPLAYRDKDKTDPALVAKTLHEMALDHLTQPGGGERKDLYRIFVYDCRPLAQKAHYPVSEQAIDFSETPEAAFRERFHQEVTRLRKVVLRLGRLDPIGGWRVRAIPLVELLASGRGVAALTDEHFEYNVVQKGVEMKIGLDIASVAYKKQADQIVLVAGDPDFVSAAKLARREGIDFILDPMWTPIARDLHEHIDGLRSTCPRILTKMERIKLKLEAQREKAKAQPPAATHAADTGTSGTGNVMPMFEKR